MTENETRYEVKEVRAIRGAEARTVDRQRKQGWEMISQARGSALHTNLTFRRPKPKVPWKSLTAVGAVVAIAVTLGVVFGDSGAPASEEPAPVASSTSTQPTLAASDASSDEIGPKPSDEASEDGVVYPDENVFKYGEAAMFEVRQSCGYTIAGGECEGHYPIEVTVDEPTAYVPTDPAGAMQGDIVYFTVTIRNLARFDAFDVNGMPSEVISGLEQVDPSLDRLVGHGTRGDQLFYDPANHIGTYEGGMVEPGASISFREGFSVANAKDVVYAIRPYGIGGDELFFQW